jgi:nucleoside-diphosphate-sugar epimerase
MLIHHSTRTTLPPRTVVIGARGFIGSYLTERLRARGAGSVSIGSADVDLTTPESVSKLRAIVRPDDAVVFLSALTPDKGKDVRTSMRNLAMGEHICAALVSNPVGQVVYVSSDAVYDDDASPITEASPRSASTLYGLMHSMRERMLQQTLAGTPARLAILRPVALYGPGDSHNGYGPNRFLRTAVSARRIDLFGGGEEKRDHLRVEDFVDVMELVLAHGSEGVVNVASGSARSFHDIAHIVRNLIGGDVEIHTSARATPITHRHVDITDLVRSFPGFRPAPLESGLPLMVEASAPSR